MVYFISGHRDVTEKEFEENYVKQIDKALESDPSAKFVIGDYEGVDVMAQKYLCDIGQEARVTVYHMFKKPRFFDERITKFVGGYTTDVERDGAMTKCSQMDIAFVRKGKWASGTAQNIKRRHELV